LGDPGFFYSSLILKEGNIPWIPHQAQNNKKYFLDSRFRGNDIRVAGNPKIIPLDSHFHGKKSHFFAYRIISATL